MSPEQTGRISKNMDFRSDIYSLGISFYEMLTGKLPFVGDKLALVHAQITKKLPNIPDIKEALNNVLQKMSSKNPSERYYSAFGVFKDLEQIEENFDKLTNFEIGLHDIKEFQIPNKLYGREDELKLLKKSMKEGFRMCLISGSSGLGKSALCEELLKDHGLELVMAYGKFDQFSRSTPYSAFFKFSTLFFNLQVLSSL
jgi:serine/threonine protein kinase